VSERNTVERANEQAGSNQRGRAQASEREPSTSDRGSNPVPRMSQCIRRLDVENRNDFYSVIDRVWRK